MAFNRDGTILLTASLTGNQETPTRVNTKAKGLVTIIVEEDRSLTINGVFDSLSGPVTACHFHKAVQGVAGAVVLNLLPYVKGNRIYGKIANPGKAFLIQLMSDSLYVNVHTTLNSGGEIRGQVFTQTDYHFWTILSGAFEVPGVLTQALGLASVVVSRSLTRLEYKIVVNGLSGAITGAHFHKGSPTVAGPVAYSLTSSGNVLTGSLAVTAGFIDSIALGLVYVNVHTAANPGGEIRGQLGWTDGPISYDALMDGANENPAVTTNAKGLAIAWTNEALDSLQYAVLYTGLTATNAHFHTGPKGVNGGVLIALTPYTIPGIASTNAYVAKIPWSNDNLNKLLKDEIYINIYTNSNPSGEIRGQLKTSLRQGIVSDLCSQQELPSNNSNAIGVGFVSIDPNKTIGYAEIVTNGLSGNALGGYIRKGAKCKNGVVWFNLGSSNNNAYLGYFLPNSTTAADSLINGLMYYSIRTLNYPQGEIRGQIANSAICNNIINWCEDSSTCRYKDSLALVSFFNATNGQNWTPAYRWDFTKPMTQWKGVGLNAQGCVECLDLDGDATDCGSWSENPPGVGLSGAFPSAIGQLTNLYRLHLRGNRNLTGQIPDSIRYLRNLAALYIDGCNLSGAFPDGFRYLTNLEDFTGYKTPFNAPLADVFGNIKKMDSFSMNDTETSGTIPTSLANVDALRRLYLARNKLNGTVPSALSNRLLHTFDISDNDFDSLPKLNPIQWQITFIEPPALALQGNRFTFDDIVPTLKVTPATFAKTYAPQDSIFQQITYTQNVGDPLSIDLKIDGALTTNSYKWFKNGVPFRTPTNSNTLVFNSLQTTDAGVYTCEVTNPDAPLLTLYGRKITIVANPIIVDTASCRYIRIFNGMTPDAADNRYFTVEGADVQILMYNRWNELVFKSDMPYDNAWNGTDQKGKPLPEGTYYYVLKFNTLDRKPCRGYILLMR